MTRAFVANALAAAVGRILGPVLDYRLRYRWGAFKDRAFSYANAGAFRRFGRAASISRTCVLVNPGYVSIGDGATIGPNCTISAWDNYAGERFQPEIVIGDHTAIGAECHITAIDRIVIGDGVLFGKKITVTDNAHGAPDESRPSIRPTLRPLFSKGPVIIEDHVWVGDKATILPGVRIGRGAIIGANSVVAGDVPAGGVAVGNPAKVVKVIRQSSVAEGDGAIDGA